MQRLPKYILVVLAIIGVIGALLYFFYSLVSDHERDDTQNIKELINKPLTIDRPWFLETHDDGHHYLGTGEARDSYPRTIEDYEQKAPSSYTPPITGAIPPRIPFRILKLTFRSSVGGMFYDLTIEFLDGDYKGRQFDVNATEILNSAEEESYAERKKWTLRSDINILE